MDIISGKLKGKHIPFINEKFDNANATPQKVKKALFSILGEDLAGKSFLDLYSCSGQIGIEAVSRGAGQVVFNEIDHDRYLFIKSMIDKLELNDISHVFNYHSYRCLRYLKSKELMFDYIFIDAPYLKYRINDLYNEIFRELNKHDLLKSGGLIIFQHASKTRLKPDPGKYQYVSTKQYAKNSLSVYRLSDEE